MILIADSGSTKTDWMAISKDGRKCFSSEGLNPSFMSPEAIRDSIGSSLPQWLSRSGPNEIHFFGAGVTESRKPMMVSILKEIFPDAAAVSADSDMLGAARALLGHGKGFAAILGTGMNSCFYDGNDIAMNVPSLGFILGDEGSAGYIGRILVREFLRGGVPEELRGEVAKAVGLDRDGIIAQVYRKPAPNRWCAGLCRFAGERKDAHPYYHGLILSGFRDFFRNVICHYPDYKSFTLNCAGSVADGCRDILEEAAGEYGMKIGTILKSPLKGLADFYG